MSATATFTPTAATVAAAETELTYAERAAAEAEAAVNVLRKRIADSNAAKTEIAARRNVGDCRDSDAGDVALLDLDREGLFSLLAEAEAAAAPARVARNAARQALATAQHHAQIAEDTAALAALTAHADRLAELLAFTLGAIDEVAQRAGQAGRPAWVPTRGFYEVVRRQASLAGLL